MIKKDRQRLYSMMREAISKVGVVNYEDTSIGVFEFELMSIKHGRIAGAFYNAEDIHELPWMACRLRDWPIDEDGYAVREWNGLIHWKQNFNAFHGPSPIQFVEEAMNHLDALGCVKAVTPAGR